MKKVIYLAAFVLVGSFFVKSTFLNNIKVIDSYKPGTDIFRVDGSEFIGNDGEPIILTGMNVGQWLMLEGYLWELGEHRGQSYSESISDRDIRERLEIVLSSTDLSVNDFMEKYRDSFFNDGDVKFLKDIGINFLRIPFSEKDLEASLPYMDQALEWCEEFEIYCLFDLHTANAPQSIYYHSDYKEGDDMWWDSEEAQVATVRALVELGERYNGNKWLAGFDVLNEPQAPSDKVLQEWYASAISTLRESGFQHLLFIQPNYVSLNVESILQSDSGVVYSPHYYGTSRRMMDDHKDVFALKNDKNYPIFIGETGNWAEDWWAEYTDVFILYGYRSAQVPFAYWNYKDLIGDSNASFGLVSGSMSDELVLFKEAVENKVALEENFDFDILFESFVTKSSTDRPAVVDLFRKIHPDTVLDIFESREEIEDELSGIENVRGGRFNRGDYLWEMNQLILKCNGMTVRDCFRL